MEEYARKPDSCSCQPGNVGVRQKAIQTRRRRNGTALGSRDQKEQQLPS